MIRVLFCAYLATASTLCLTSSPLNAEVNLTPENVLRVPEEYKTIQAAVDAAPEHATVLVAPGIYHEAIKISGKSVKLVSWYLNTKDSKYIHQTVLDGSIHPDPTPDNDIDDVRPYVILIEETAGEETTILGFTIRDGDDGISCYAKSSILFNRFVNNTDAVDYEGGGGECRFNTFTANDDDAIDLDLDCEVLVANNVIHDNDDDGIEIRLHEYSGEVLDITIRENTIIGNGEDGIQIIDYPDLSDRRLTIERNVIANNAMAGIGMMANGVTLENFEAAAIPEPIAIVNNTICQNDYGITGGHNVQIANNIICTHLHAPLLKVRGQSSITHNLLWDNGSDPIESNTSEGVIINESPQLDGAFRPAITSSCINTGTIGIQLESNSPTVLPSRYLGSAPDLGAYEVE